MHLCDRFPHVAIGLFQPELDFKPFVNKRDVCNTDSCREHVYHLPARSVREDNETLFISSLHKCYTSVLLPVPHCLLKDSSLGSWKRNPKAANSEDLAFRKTSNGFHLDRGTVDLIPVDISRNLGPTSSTNLLYHTYAWLIALIKHVVILVKHINISAYEKHHLTRDLHTSYSMACQICFQDIM